MEEVTDSESHSTLPSYTEAQSSREQSSDVNSSENVIPNVSSDSVGPSNNPSSSEQAPPMKNETDSNILLNQVTSTSETYIGTIKHNLPSINHQSVLIPNMEPYLEEGSLDGSPKEDPASSNVTSVVEKVNANSTNGPPSSEFIPLNLLEDVSNPVLARPNVLEKNADGLTTLAEMSLDPMCQKEPLPKEIDHTFNNVDESTVMCTRQNDDKLEEATAELPASEISSEPSFVSDESSMNHPGQIYLLKSYQPNLQDNPLNSDNPATEKCEEGPGPVILPLEDSIIPQRVDNVMQKMCHPISELNVEPQKEELEKESTENVKEIHSETAESAISDLLAKERCSADLQFDKESNSLKTPDNDYPFSVNEEAKEDSTISSADQHFETTKVEDCNKMGDKTQGEYMQYDQKEGANSHQEVQTTNASVCGADGSAVGLNGAVFSGAEVTMDSQSVYVVDDSMALNSIPQSDSMTPYHNSESAMLVEMAPLPTDGSYVNSHTQVC